MNSEKTIELKAKAIIAENTAKSTIELYYTNLKNENERLHSIIKEVREYIESYGITKEQLRKMPFGSAAPISIGEMLNILEILDKESE